MLGLRFLIERLPETLIVTNYYWKDEIAPFLEYKVSIKNSFLKSDLKPSQTTPWHSERVIATYKMPSPASKREHVMNGYCWIKFGNCDIFCAISCHIFDKQIYAICTLHSISMIKIHDERKSKELTKV